MHTPHPSEPYTWFDASDFAPVSNPPEPGWVQQLVERLGIALGWTGYSIGAVLIGGSGLIYREDGDLGVLIAGSVVGGIALLIGHGFRYVLAGR